jgi:predicted double-glycine peptidase
MKRSHIPCILALLFFLAGCATSIETLPSDAWTIDQVPYFEQEDFQCGPAALATVINYWYTKNKSNKRLSVETIVDQIYSHSAKGVLGLDLEAYARKLGFNAVQPSGAIEEIRKSIDAKIPVIILVDYGGTFHQQNHFMVAKGYTHDGIVFNSGRRENHLISNETLQKIWKKTGFWALIIRP